MPILEALPEPKQAKIRALLSYNPETAGGLMSPNFLALREDTTVADALEEVRRSQVPPEALSIHLRLRRRRTGCRDRSRSSGF